MTRRFSAGEYVTVSGVPFRIVDGAKVPGDLRLESWSEERGRWEPVKMSLALFLVDFFTENEQHIKNHRSWWRQNGDMYFIRVCVDAVRRGWRVVAEDIARQRRNAA